MTMAAIPQIEWRYFSRSFKQRWKQGEQTSIFGPTGGGKTTLAQRLMLWRDYVVIIATKNRDRNLSQFVEKYKFELYKQWPPLKRHQRVVLWVPPKKLEDGGEQRARIVEALEDIYKEGGWTVYFDEVAYIYDNLSMKSIIRMFYTQSRSNDITVIGGTQRPAYVPGEMYSQPTHLFFFQFREKRDLDRIGEINVSNSDEVKETIANLKQYHFLYVNRVSGDMCISKVERKQS